MRILAKMNLRRDLFQPPNLIRLCGSILIAALLFTIVLIIPVPVYVSKAVHNLNLIISAALLLLFTLLFSRRGWIWKTISLSLVFVLFALPLTYRWQTGFYSGNIIGGLLPWSDSNGYYLDAQRLMLGFQFTSFSSRRPLYAGLLAVLLAITRLNLQVTLAIFVALNAAACYIAAREVQATHGSFAGAFTLIGLFIFYKPYIGIVLTENLGFCLAVFAFTAIWRGAWKKQEAMALVGLFMLSVALNARAGAFFILPTIVLWGCLYFRGSKHFSASFLVKGLSVVIAAFLLNFALFKAIGSPGGAMFANYAETFYGLVSGNAGWYQVRIDYPGLPESKIWGIAFEKLKQNPGLFGIGILRSYGDYFAPVLGAFSFMPFSDRAKVYVNIGMWFLTGLGLIQALFSRSRTRDSLMVLAFLGILLSVGLVPPSDAGQMRVYAATIPFTIFLAANSFLFPLLFVKNNLVANRSNLTDGLISNSLLATTGLVIIGISVVGPVIVKLAGISGSANRVLNCPANQEHLELLVTPGNYLEVVPDDAINESYLPYIRISDFRNSVSASSRTYPELVKALMSIGPNDFFTAGMNRLDYYYHKSYGINIYLISDSLPPVNQFFDVCATSTQNYWLKKYRFYYANGSQSGSLQPAGLFFRSEILNRNVRRVYGLLFCLILFFACLQWINMRALTLRKKILLFCSFVLIANGLFVYYHGKGSLPFFWEKRNLYTGLAIHGNGFSYSISLGTDWMNQAKMGKSPGLVLENGNALSFPNAMHADISSIGSGRFSIWNGNVLFSSSDNSDPRSNGRRYELYWPKPISTQVQWMSFALFWIAWGILIFVFKDTIFGTARSLFGIFFPEIKSADRIPHILWIIGNAGVTVLFSLGVALLLLNLLGFVIPLRNPALYSYYKNSLHPTQGHDITLTYQESMQQIKRLPGESDETYVYRLNHVINQSISSYWYDEGIDTFHLRVPIWENYILWYYSLRNPGYYLRYEYTDYHKAIQRGIGLCSEFAIVVTEILEQNGIDAKMIGLNGHVVSSAKVGENWYIVDALYDVVIPYSLEDVEKDPKIVERYYSNTNAPPFIPSLYISGNDNVIFDSAEAYATPKIFKKERLAYQNIWVIPMVLMAPFFLVKLAQILALSFRTQRSVIPARPDNSIPVRVENRDEDFSEDEGEIHA